MFLAINYEPEFYTICFKDGDLKFQGWLIVLNSLLSINCLKQGLPVEHLSFPGEVLNKLLTVATLFCYMHLPFVLCIALHFECRSFSARSMIVKPSKSAVLAGAAAGARVYPGLVVLQHVSFPFRHIIPCGRICVIIHFPDLFSSNASCFRFANVF